MVINDNKEEKLPVIADYNFDKTAPIKMSKKERVWVPVLRKCDRQTRSPTSFPGSRSRERTLGTRSIRSHGGHKNMIFFKSFALQLFYSKA